MHESILKTLRETNKISQEELAKQAGMSRPILIAIEKGDKKIGELPYSTIEKLCSLLDIDIASLVENKIPKEPEINIVKSKPKEVNQEIRIDVPQERVDKFKEILLYILKKVGAEPKVGMTYLYKILYFIDFDFYEKYEEQLMGLKYQKNTRGPTPMEFTKITKKMIEKNELKEVKGEFYGMEQKKFIPIREPDLSMITGKEQEHINKTIDRLISSFDCAKQISDYSHDDIPWIVTKDKDIIPYESVFYRNDKTSVRVYEE